MRAGLLRHRLAIQAATLTQDSTGEAVEGWVTEATVWGRVEPLQDWQRARLPQEVEGSTHRITLRYYAGLTPQKRILFGTRIFYLAAPLNTEERNIETVVTAKEFTPNEVPAEEEEEQP